MERVNPERVALLSEQLQRHLAIEVYQWLEMESPGDKLSDLDHLADWGDEKCSGRLVNGAVRLRFGFLNDEIRLSLGREFRLRDRRQRRVSQDGHRRRGAAWVKSNECPDW